MVKLLKWKALGLSFVIRTQLTQFSVSESTRTNAIQLPGLVFLKERGFDLRFLRAVLFWF